MSNKGTEVHLKWDQPIPEKEVQEAVKNVAAGMRISSDDGRSFQSDILGPFHVAFRGNSSEMLVSESHITFFECDVLPELAVLHSAYMRDENACRECYHYIKRLFIASSADLCCGATRADEVRPFDFSDTLICRAFRFSKRGPQKLILPYEENRSIIDFPLEPNEYSDTQFNPNREEPNWVLHMDAPI